MRQVGVLAAAGQVALKRTLPRLGDDHDNAKRLAAGLSTIPGLKVDEIPFKVAPMDVKDDQLNNRATWFTGGRERHRD